MLPVPPKKSESKRRVLFVGICADAVKLGVSREHLYRVLTGQRVSKSLVKRYQELKAKGEQPIKQPAQPDPAPTTFSAAIKPGAQPAPLRMDATPRGYQKSTNNMKGKL